MLTVPEIREAAVAAATTGKGAGTGSPPVGKGSPPAACKGVKGCSPPPPASKGYPPAGKGPPPPPARQGRATPPPPPGKGQKDADLLAKLEHNDVRVREIARQELGIVGPQGKGKGKRQQGPPRAGKGSPPPPASKGSPPASTGEPSDGKGPAGSPSATNASSPPEGSPTTPPTPPPPPNKRPPPKAPLTSSSLQAALAAPLQPPPPVSQAEIDALKNFLRAGEGTGSPAADMGPPSAGTRADSPPAGKGMGIGMGSTAVPAAASADMGPLASGTSADSPPAGKGMGMGSPAAASADMGPPSADMGSPSANVDVDDLHTVINTSAHVQNVMHLQDGLPHNFDVDDWTVLYDLGQFPQVPIATMGAFHVVGWPDSEEGPQLYLAFECNARRYMALVGVRSFAVQNASLPR